MTAAELFNINGSVLALLGVMATVIANYIVQRKKSETEEHNIDRSILSKDQKDFKDSLLVELNECRDTVDKLKHENDELRNKALDDKSDKVKLYIQVTTLQNEIIRLKETITEIMGKVEKD